MERPNKIYDLEERTFEFARNTRVFVRKLEINIWNREDIKQLVRSSGSVAANYIEAIEKLGDKDFLMKLRISKKEAKETILWLRLIEVKTDTLEEERIGLINEAKELQNILGAIYKKSISKKIA
jgi:four helix bundle protein